MSNDSTNMEAIAAVIGDSEAAAVIAMGVLVRALRKQPGINGEQLVADMIEGFTPAPDQPDTLKHYRDLLQLLFGPVVH